jgi:hypothetical protein
LEMEDFAPRSQRYQFALVAHANEIRQVLMEFADLGVGERRIQIERLARAHGALGGKARRAFSACHS